MIRGQGGQGGWRGRQLHDHRQPQREECRDSDRARGDLGAVAARARSQHVHLRPRLPSDGGLSQLDHLPRRRQRRPPVPGLPDPGAGRAVQLPRGRLPDHPRRAAVPGGVREVDARHHLPHLRPRERAEAVHGRLPPRRPPHGNPRGHRRRTVDLLSRGEEHRRPRSAHAPGRSAHRQDADAGRLRPPLLDRAANGLPRQLARLPVELPVDDVEDRRAPLRGRPHPGPGARPAVHPPRRPRAELLDHRHAGRRLGPRRPILVYRRRLRRPLRAAPRRGQRGRRPDADRDRFAGQHRALRERRQGGQSSTNGIRPPGLQELRPPRPDHQGDRRSASSRSPATTRCSTSP